VVAEDLAVAVAEEENHLLLRLPQSSSLQFMLLAGICGLSRRSMARLIYLSV
jgi:hypothetical protein